MHVPSILIEAVVVGILTFKSGKNSILGFSEPKKAKFLDIFILIWAFKISCSVELSIKKFITSGPDHGQGCGHAVGSVSKGC